MNEAGNGKETLWPVQLGQCREEGHCHLAWGQLRLLCPRNKIFGLVLDGSGATQPLPSLPRRTWLNTQEKTSRKSFGERVPQQLQGVLEKICFLLDAKRDPNLTFSPSILWSAPTTWVCSTEAGRLSASYKTLVQHFCCITASSCDLGQVTHLHCDSLPPAVKQGQLYRTDLRVGCVVKIYFLDIVEYLNSFWVKISCWPTMLCPSLQERLPNVHGASHNDSVIFYFWQDTISYFVFFVSVKMLLSNNDCQTKDTLKLQTTRHSENQFIKETDFTCMLRAKLGATVLLIVFVNLLELGAVGNEGGGREYL